MELRDITKIVIMDFDGTLMNTMTPEVGKPLWREKTGFDWPHKGWWAQSDSLDMVVFGSEPIEKVIQAYRQRKEEPGTLMVMMTGRVSWLGRRVKDMLHTHELFFDEYIFNCGGSTLEYKINKLNEFVKFLVTVTEIEIWEDRPEHTKAFIEWGEQQENVEVIVHQV